MSKFYDINKIRNTILQGNTIDELKKIPDNSIDTIMTSPPYWGLRAYLSDDHPDKSKEIGLEPTLDQFIDKLLAITAELKRVLKKTGVMYWNHGDCYNSTKCGLTDKKKIDYLEKPQGDGLYNRQIKRYGKTQKTVVNEIPIKCLCLQNWRLILRMIDDQGWTLRNTIIWNKPNSMPSSVQDRYANTYEPVYMLVKNKTYYFDLDAVRVKSKILETRPGGVVRTRNLEYNSKYRAGSKFTLKYGSHYDRFGKNTNKFNIKNRVKRGGKPVCFMASLQETNKKQKFITPDQQKETQNRTGWKDGSGRVRSFFDNYGGETNSKGKNPGDVFQIPLDHPTGLLTREESAYIAGLLDSDGCITLQSKKTNDLLFITITNTHRGVLEWLKDRFGIGRVYGIKRDKKWREAWDFNLYCSNAASLLYAIYPWLIIKKEQAKTALEFQSLGVKTGQKIEKQAKQRRKELVEEMHNLNQYRIFQSSSPNPLKQDYDSLPNDVWKIPTQPFPEAHFAVYPEKICVKPIRSSCPQWICKKCGKPRTRIIKIHHNNPKQTQEQYKEVSKVKEGITAHQNYKLTAVLKIKGSVYADHETLGWTNCGCNAGWEKGIVLDPFAGAATTLIVARNQNRDYIGIELSKEYIKIAEKRLAQKTLGF